MIYINTYYLNISIKIFIIKYLTNYLRLDRRYAEFILLFYIFRFNRLVGTGAEIRNEFDFGPHGREILPISVDARYDRCGVEGGLRVFDARDRRGGSVLNLRP